MTCPIGFSATRAGLLGQPLPQGIQQRHRIPLRHLTATLSRHLPAGVLDPVELPDPGQHRHQAQNLGRFLGIEPLRPDAPVHPTRILFVYKATSPYNRRVEQARALKRLPGRQYRSLVTKASRSTKKDFLKYDLTESGCRPSAVGSRWALAASAGSRKG